MVDSFAEVRALHLPPYVTLASGVSVDLAYGVRVGTVALPVAFGTIGGFCTLEAPGSSILFVGQSEGTTADIHASETVRLQNDVERLIPWHVDEPDGYPTSNVVGDYDVLAADL
jgi:hypothetical protein